MPSTRQPDRAEYEPLNPAAADSTSDLSWEEKQSPPSSSSSAASCCGTASGTASGAAAFLSPRAFWALCAVALLTVLNLALYPRTLSTSAAHYAPTALPTIGSSPGLDRARAQGGLASYKFVKPARIGSADAHDAQPDRGAVDAMWAPDRALRVSRREHALVQFAVPAGNASAPCALAFFRPPLTVTSELTGALAAVEVWDVPAAALSSSPASSADSAPGGDGPAGDAPLSLARAQERMLATLDLTRQAALATSGEFACAAGERRVFEIRCPAAKACVVQYTDKPKLNIGFQLRRKV